MRVTLHLKLEEEREFSNKLLQMTKKPKINSNFLKRICIFIRYIIKMENFDDFKSNFDRNHLKLYTQNKACICNKCIHNVQSNND